MSAHDQPKRIQSYPGVGFRVQFDPNVCIHAAVCLGLSPAVFDASKPRWIRPKEASEAEVRATVAKCPSGALSIQEGDASPGAAS